MLCQVWTVGSVWKCNGGDVLVKVESSPHFTAWQRTFLSQRPIGVLDGVRMQVVLVWTSKRSELKRLYSQFILCFWVGFFKCINVNSGKCVRSARAGHVWSGRHSSAKGRRWTLRIWVECQTDSVKDCVRTSHRRRTQVETHFYTFPRITSVYVRSLVLSMARTALLRVTRVETGHLTGKIWDREKGRTCSYMVSL